MQTFTIKQIEQLTGIKAPTLRIWEKRYHLLEPGRSDGKQRVYSNEDLRSILKVVYLYRKGLRISRIAKLKDQQLLQQLADNLEKPGSFSEMLPLLMEAAIALDSPGIESVINSLEKEHGLETTMVRVIYPFLENLGRAWVTGKVLPNNEHFVSSIIIRKILFATDKLMKPAANGNVVLLFQPAGEFHEIPLLFMNYLFKKHGWQTVYFGSNVPLEALEEYCTHKKATHIYFHLVTLLPGKTPAELLATLANRFPSLKIVAGGQLAKNEKAAGPNTLLLRNENDIYHFLSGIPVNF